MLGGGLGSAVFTDLGAAVTTGLLGRIGFGATERAGVGADALTTGAALGMGSTEAATVAVARTTGALALGGGGASMEGFATGERGRSVSVAAMIASASVSATRIVRAPRTFFAGCFSAVIGALSRSGASARERSATV